MRNARSGLIAFCNLVGWFAVIYAGVSILIIAYELITPGFSYYGAFRNDNTSFWTWLRVLDLSGSRVLVGLVWTALSFGMAELLRTAQRAETGFRPPVSGGG